jgi:nucleoid-associated protein YgaU
MIGSKVIAMVAAMVVIVGVAAAGLYVYRQQQEAPSSAGAVARNGSPAPMPEQPKPQAEAKSEAKHPTVVPSFDVVRIEPSGEGVLAGRAEPGWQVNIEDQGSKIATALADAEGAWTVVLEKPLRAGDHSLSVQSASPDGARVLASQQAVPVTVGKKKAVAAMVTPEEPSPSPTRAEEETTGTTPGAAGPQPEGASPAETAAAPGAPSEPEPSAPVATAQAEPEPMTPPAPEEAAQPEQANPPEAPSGKPKGPPVRIRSVDFEEKDGGRIVLSGTGDPGAHVLVYLDEQPFGQFIIADDGTWRMEKEGELPIGEHVFNADLIDKTTGIVVGRTSVAVERRPPSSEENKPPEEAPVPEQAAPPPRAAAPESTSTSMAEAQSTPAPAEQPAAPQPAPPAAATPEGPAPQMAAAEESGQPAKPAMRHKRHRPHVYTIRRGDTLWALAERYFGGGWHYVTIYRDNRKHIRNPNRIYPKQTVKIPKH